MKKLSKRQAAAERKLLAGERQAPPAEYPAKPWMLFGKPTPNGLQAIYMMAVEGVPEKTVATLLGDTNLFGKPNVTPQNAARLSFAAGEAEEVRRMMHELDYRVHKLHDSNALYFKMRIKGYRESGATVEINTGSNYKIQMLPGDMSAELIQQNIKDAAAEGVMAAVTGMSEAAYYAKLGVSGPIESGDPAKRAAAMLLSKPNPADDTPAIKDVTPPTAAPEPARVSLGPGQAVGPGFNSTRSC